MIGSDDSKSVSRWMLRWNRIKLGEAYSEATGAALFVGAAGEQRVEGSAGVFGGLYHKFDLWSWYTSTSACSPL
jgi:hypothetical protein